MSSVARSRGTLQKTEWQDAVAAPFAAFLSKLHCLGCLGGLASAPNGLRCTTCDREYPLRNGTYKFVETQEYASSFGFQWKRYAKTQLDNESSHRSEDTFRDKTGFTPEELKGKWILDVGCGMGRYAEVASRWGAYVVAIDLSLAAETAAVNLAGRNVFILQADVFSLPFQPSSFDFIYSIGVLHHTPNCAEAFKVLPPLLAPGGKIAIWLYSAYNKWYRFSDLYRRATTKLSAPVLLRLCSIASNLYYLHKGLRVVPLFGRKTSQLLDHLLPISPDSDPEWRILDTFDWYSPKYQSKHTYEEVFRWFEECGLQARVLNEPVAVQGYKPKIS